ncbi:Uncharacterised protein [Mycobacteroides abscessus subsp. massiliense]|nr:Uncharacterised protein [Mycobacteroides abscessus subsp. massiliense]
MLKKAANRCQATPQTRLRPTRSRNRPPKNMTESEKADTNSGLSGSSFANCELTGSEYGLVWW